MIRQLAIFFIILTSSITASERPNFIIIFTDDQG